MANSVSIGICAALQNDDLKTIAYAQETPLNRAYPLGVVSIVHGLLNGQALLSEGKGHDNCHAL